jgi:mono/diheme cytochrome c family protein
LSTRIRRIRIGFVLTALVFWTPSWVLAQGDSPPASPAPEENAAANRAFADRGKELYARHCSHCHGFNMVTPGTIAFDLRTFPHNDKARFLNSVTNGKNGRMPPWGEVLSSEEMDAIWAYILTGGKS